MPGRLVCGCGYLGERVAREWLAAGHEVWVTTRSETRAADLERTGLRTVIVDITQPFRFPASAPAFSTVLSAFGFDRSARKTIEEVYVQGLEHLLDALDPASLQRFLYVSSTGVYGQSHGEWVDEDSPCQPTRAGGQACLDAEHLLARHPAGHSRLILRLAGIYGPGRIPKLDALRRGEPIESAEHGFLNLIHVEDAAAIVVAASEQLTPPALLVVSDGEPVLRGDFYREAARLLGVPDPQFLSPDTDGSNSERGLSDKRVSNRRLRDALQVTWRYPSYRAGLAAIVNG